MSLSLSFNLFSMLKSSIDTLCSSRSLIEYSIKFNLFPLFSLCHSSIFFCINSLVLSNSLFLGVKSYTAFSKLIQKFFKT